MADWPPVKPVKQPQEKEKIYLTLIDMFVDVVEPDIIQMVLQNRNWDLDSALEDIMILSSSSHSDKVHRKSSKTQSGLKAVNMYLKEDSGLTDIYQKKNVSSNVIGSTMQSQNTWENSSSSDKINKKKTKSQLYSKHTHYKVSPEVKKFSQSNVMPFLDQYNYVKAIPVSFDRAVMLMRDGVKLMVILRGPSGSGKSHLAVKLLNEAGINPSVHRKHIFSSDDFFVQNNVYVFVPDMLSQAHMWNQRNVVTAARDEVSPIIVDNTNTQAWEMRVYAEIAVSAGYDLEILEPDNWWFMKENELAKRNCHGVPKAKIRNMIERYEKHMTPNKLLQQFELRYSLSNAPPQPARYSKWRDKFNSQKSNKPKKNLVEKPVVEPSFSNLNYSFQSLPVDSPGFKQIPTFQPTLPLKNASSANSFSKDFKMQELYYSSSHQTNGENSFFEQLNISNSGTLFENVMQCKQVGNNCDGVESPNVEGSSSTLPDATPISSKSVNLPLIQHSTSNFNKQGSKHNFEWFLAQGSSNEDHQNRVPFDFMSESKKLLAALQRPASLKKNEELHSRDEELPLTPKFLSPQKESDDLLKCKGHETILSNVTEPNCVSELRNGIPKQSESFDEKIKIAKELVDLVIEKVVHDAEEAKSLEERDSSWDYVVINDDKTFTYKQLNSVPLFSQTVSYNNALPHVQTTLGSNTSTSSREHQIPKNADLDELMKTTTESLECYKVSSLEENVYYKSENSEKSNTPVCNAFTNFDENSEQIKTDVHVNSEICLAQNGIQELEKNCEEINSCVPVGIVTSVCTTNIDISGMEDCDSKVIPKEEDALCRKVVAESGHEFNTDILGMMKDILSTVVPLCENPIPTCNFNLLNNITEAEKNSDLNESDSKKNVNGDDTVAPFISTVNSFDEWDRGVDWGIECTITASSDIQPKPARNLTRPRALIERSSSSSVQSEKQPTPTTSFDTWDTVSYPLDNWNETESLIKSDDRKEVMASVLPQRCKLKNKHSVDASTNTNYLDFSLVNDENATGVKILTGSCRSITTDQDCKAVRTDMSETFLLDKSTMTLENMVDTVRSFDIKHISSLFPEIPDKYILDVVEKCQGDINWAVDLLLDSEHSIYPLSTEESEDSGNNSGAIVEIKKPNTHIEINKVHSQGKSSQKRETKGENSHEQSELKRIIESSVIFGKSHYSDKVLKVLKKKNPEYLNLIENNHSQIVEDASRAAIEEIVKEENVFKTENENTTEGNGDNEGSNTSSDNIDDEDDSLDLIVNSDLILQLQQKFGNSNLPRVKNMSPVVKLPLSLARQLYGYVMDSLQTEMDEEQNLIENMIAQDEEIAKLLQYQDQNFKPQLQEIMDFEVALAVHRSDQEGWKEKSHDTVAAKLSTNILLERFPYVDPKMLKELLHAHNYSLHDTVASLTLALGVDPSHGCDLQNALASNTVEEQPKDARTVSVLVSDEAISSTDPVSEAQTHRDQAATYYSLRMDCLNKAHEAFRSGNKPVASYYSQLAQLHKEKVEVCNSRAAACLLTFHKCGTNTLDLHFLHVIEAQVVLDMFLDTVIRHLTDKRTRQHMTVYLITGRGLRSVGGVSRIKPMVQRTLQGRGVVYAEVNPGMLNAVVRVTTPLSNTV